MKGLGIVRRLTSPLAPLGGAYFHWIDAIRGCAAVAILVWHYQHFYFRSGGDNPTGFQHELQPFYGPLTVLYQHGYFAVQLFWVISGFVFASVYAGTIPTSREFFVNRFARLYPLHFATLVLVAVLQAISYHRYGQFQIYQNNDAYHFLLNLGFVSHWGFEAGYSFNAPVWSVSVEVFIYILFWATLRYVFVAGIVGPLLFAALFMALMGLKVPGPFWECGVYFYFGCASYVWLASFRERNGVNSVLGLCAIAAGSAYLASGLPGPGMVGRLALFCGLVILAGSADIWDREHRGARFAWLGNITYSVYLLHIPVQIAVLLLMNAWGVDRAIANQSWFFLSFIAVMCGLATASYRFFELPMRRWVRRRLSAAPTPVPVQNALSPTDSKSR